LLINKQENIYLFLHMFFPDGFINLQRDNDFNRQLTIFHPMDRPDHPNFIIISGSGKKVGKTFLAMALIEHFFAQSPVIALKISPHRHDQLGNVVTISITPGFRLYRELEVHDKNSGQFVAAGASASYFLETEDSSLKEALNDFLITCNPLNQPVICESGALGRMINPGVLIYIAGNENHPDLHKESIRNSADMILPARQFSVKEIIRNIELRDNGFISKKKM
jgi:hypothetical protein